MTTLTRCRIRRSADLSPRAPHRRSPVGRTGEGGDLGRERVDEVQPSSEGMARQVLEKRPRTLMRQRIRATGAYGEREVTDRALVGGPRHEIPVGLRIAPRLPRIEGEMVERAIEHSLDDRTAPRRERGLVVVGGEGHD